MKKIFSILAALLVALTASADNLPKMTINVTGSIGTDWNDNCTISVADASNVIGGDKTSVTVSVEYSGSGNSKNYRLKFAKKKHGNFFSSDTTYKQWTLLSNSDDPTLMRNAMADEVSKIVGMEYTPQYQYVDLYIGSTYAGVYLLTDRIKCEVGRACAGDATGLEWLVQMGESTDVTTSDTYVTGTETMPYIVMKNPDPDDFVDDQATLNVYKNNMQTYFTSFFNDPKEKVKQDQFVAWYIASEIICNYKGFSEVYAYRSTYGAESNQLLRFGPIWDNEKGFNNNASHYLSMDSLITAKSNDGLMLKYADHKLLRKWVKNIMESTTDTWFSDAVWTKWQTVKSSEQTLLNKVTELHNAIAKTSVSRTADTTAEEALKTYITKRFEYLDARFAELTGHATVDGVTSLKAPESNDDAIYSITGQRLSSIPSHGVYVKNGKKMIVLN